MSRLPTSDQRTLPKPSSNGSRIQLQRTNLPSPKKSTNPKPTNSTLEKKTNGVSGLKPPSGISKIGEFTYASFKVTIKCCIKIMTVN